MASFKKLGGFALLESAISLIVVSGFLSSYQDQQTSKQLVQDVLSYSKSSQIAVVKYYEQNGVLPTSNKQINLPSRGNFQHPLISNIEIGEFGQITITLSDEDSVASNNLSEEIYNKTIILEPRVKQGSVIWSCNNGSLDNIYRPENCKKIEREDYLDELYDDKNSQSEDNYL